MGDRSILILNGPGLADSGGRDGNGGDNLSLEQIEEGCSALCERLNLKMDFRQTDDQDEMSRWIIRSSEAFDALIINPGGHSRAASMEPELYHSALKMIAHLDRPVTEVHIANIFNRGTESTRPLQVPEAEMGFICGLGLHGYLLAIKAANQRLQAR